MSKNKNVYFVPTYGVRTVGRLMYFRSKCSKLYIEIQFPKFSIPFSKWKKVINSLIKAGVDVMITMFCDFWQFSAKKLAFFSKTNVMIKILHNLALFWVGPRYSSLVLVLFQLGNAPIFFVYFFTLRWMSLEKTSMSNKPFFHY
jgi:hypothetical protein